MGDSPILRNMDVRCKISPVEHILDDGRVIAIIVRSNFSEEGIHFFTPNDFSQQLAYMKHPAGKKIAAHYHVAMGRQVEYTQEVLVIRKGRLRVDFFDTKEKYMESRTLRAGDVILLAHGGHGFEVLDDLEMIEVKQGPYLGADDKVRIDSKVKSSSSVNA